LLHPACHFSGRDVGLWPADFPLTGAIYGWQATTLLVNCPLWISQLGQLCFPSIRGR